MLDSDRLYMTLEQLDVVRHLLQSDSDAKAQMALIQLDAIADAIVHGRLHAIYESGEHRYMRLLRQIPVYSQKQRDDAKREFSRRLSITQRVTGVQWWNSSDRDFLSEADAAILRVGHTYRNIAYHQGVHNPNLLPSLARVLFHTVARLVVNAGDGWHRYPSREDSEQLRQWGIEDPSKLNGQRDLAEAVTAVFVSDLPLDARKIARALADDLDERVDRVRADLGFLDDNLSVDPWLAVLNVELAMTYGADEELLRLEGQLDPTVVVSDDGELTLSAKPVEETHAAWERYWLRRAELADGHVQSVGPKTIDRTEKAARRLRLLTEISRVLTAYAQIDKELVELQRYVGVAATEVDQEIQREIDIRRGK